MRRKKEKRTLITSWNSVPVIIDLPYAAAILGVCHESARQLVAHGDIPARKIGKEWRINKRDLQRYLGVGEEEAS